MVDNLSPSQFPADCMFCYDAVQVHSFIGHISDLNIFYIVAPPDRPTCFDIGVKTLQRIGLGLSQYAIYYKNTSMSYDFIPIV
jgi:hypothetical protein